MDLTYLPIAMAILSLILLLVNLLLIWDRRKLKGFDTDKKLKLIDIQIEETQVKYKEKKTEAVSDFGRRNIAGGPAARSIIQSIEDEEKRKLDNLNIEKEHLQKLKSYRFMGIRI